MTDWEKMRNEAVLGLVFVLTIFAGIAGLLWLASNLFQQPSS